MDTLHTSSGHIVGLTDPTLGTETSPDGAHVSLWHQALCPLLQGIARYCCDIRTSVSNKIKYSNVIHLIIKNDHQEK